MARLEERTDDELLIAFNREGDERSFGALVMRHQAMMFRVAHRILGNTQDAEDAMQRSLIVFARRAIELKNTGSVAGWLHRVVTLESLALSRKRSIRINHESGAMKEQLIQADRLPAAALPELDQSIQALKPQDRQAVILHYLEGHSFPDIASRLGGTSDGWRKRCSRALDKLAEKLRSRGVGSATAITIAATFGSQSAEAAMSPQLIAEMTRDALLQKTTAGALSATATITFVIMKMKIGLILSVVGGTMLSFAVGHHRGSDEEEASEGASVSTVSQEVGRNQRPSRRFDLATLVAALNDFDEAASSDIRTERRLRMLMFSIPSTTDIEAVAGAIKDVENPARFREIVAALYARWAELDAAAAWEATKTSGHSSPAREGAMLTWLCHDRDAAFEALMESRENGDLMILAKFLRHKSGTAPRDAALFVDQIAKVWPEADQRLFPLVANEWVMSDPMAAGQWVASHPDSNRRNNLLGSLAQRITREWHGLLGVDLANMIDDPEKRAAARESSIRWFGVATGTSALKDERARPNRDLRAGFPEDWNPAEISAFARGCMVNYVKDYQLLVDVARNDEERQSIYLGAIQGAGFSNPALVSDAAENLDSSIIETNPDHSESLRVFMIRWNEMDAESAKAWLDNQPPGPKKQVMQAAISEVSEKQ